MTISIDGWSSDDKLLSPLNSDSSKNVKIKHDNKSHFIKIDFSSQRTFRSSKKARKKKSPYCVEDKVNLLSNLHEKQAMRRKQSEVMNYSCPLDTQIYKANSDEFRKNKTGKRKFKKSILTLPTETSLTPQVHTVSDMNESEYNRKDQRMRRKQNCRTMYRCNNKPKNNEKYFYDGGTQYYSKLKIDLDCSSSDIAKPFKRNRQKRKEHTTEKSGKCNSTDVWALLRNFDRFNLRPSPPMSDNSLEQLKEKNRLNKKRSSPKDTRLIKTRRTEEIAYISSSFEHDRSPPSISPSSSCDRVTVIDKLNKTNNLCGNMIKPISCQQSGDRRRLRCTMPSLNKNTNSIETEIVNKARSKFKDTNKKLQEDRNFNNQNGKHQCSSPNSNNKYQPTSGLDITSAYPAVSNNFYREPNNQHYLTDDSQDKGANMTSAESSKHVIKGITKVVLKENEKTLQGENDSPKRKSRLVTTMPSSCNSPKLTLTDKRRILANQKFPITILAKDQVNPVRLSNFEFSQFSGLDHQIWPFMLDWFGKDPLKKCKVREQKKNIDPTFQKSSKLTEQKPSEFSSHDTKRNISSNCNKNEAQVEEVKPYKCFNQIKNRMFKFVDKKSHTNLNSTMEDLVISSPQQLSQDIKKQINIGLVDVGTGSSSRTFDKQSPERFPPLSYERLSPETKQPLLLVKPYIPKTDRAKQNWANNFIETVIEKVRNGIYVTQRDLCSKTITKKLISATDFRNKTLHICKSEYHETETPHELEVSNESAKYHEFDDTMTSLLMTNIPGFDDPLPALEVLTLADNRIAIKQCLTNITLQFDIAIPLEFNDLQTTGTVSSLLNSTEYLVGNILKYKKTITNAILPAELCSIVPKMLHELSINKTKMALSTFKINELSTIAELPRYAGINKQPNIVLSAGMKIVIGGSYPRCPPSFIPTPRIRANSNNAIICKMSPKLDVKKIHLLMEINLPRLMFFKREKYQKPACLTERRDNDLSLKSNNSSHVAEYRGKFDFSSFMEKIINSSNFIINVNIQNFLNLYTFEFSKTTDLITDKLVIKVTIDPFQRQTSTDSICNINTMMNSLPSSDNNTVKNKQTKKIVSTKIRKINYLRLSRKCKSASSIPETKKCTPLDEVTNLEEFCQVLGSGKMLSSVLNGKEEIIMRCITQLKTWISEINSSQAMLVLLLLNKKDSPNLTRLRPVILQGIAVKRITKVSELDMEVEVIENEKFKGLSEYAQNTQKPATVTVTDPDDESLLEELCWIAKTTASDYQKLYDDTSEKLLKFLINKRKKLNPSYLRVMARYVGLGLLKSAGKL